MNGYNITGNSITVPFSKTGFGHYLVVRVIQDFRDFYGKKEGRLDLEWARPYVMELWSRGIMDALEKYPDGSPVPEGFFGLTDSTGKSEVPITRKEFISMLVRGMRLPVTVTPPHLYTYQDMEGLTMQEVQYIEAGVKAGWVPNTTACNGKLLFHPNNPLTREQACTIMARAAGLNLMEQARADQIMKAYFSADYASTYSWNRPHIIACIQAGLLPLDRQGYLEPGKAVTRAGAAEMVYKLLLKANKL